MGVTTLGIIGGAGWLAGALLRPALAKGVVRAEDVILSSRRPAVAGFEVWPAIRTTTDNKALAVQSDIVILSVRPEDLAGVEADLSGKLVISVMARMPAAEIRKRFGCDRVVRTMPNASARFGSRCTAGPSTLKRARPPSRQGRKARRTTPSKEAPSQLSKVSRSCWLERANSRARKASRGPGSTSFRVWVAIACTVASVFLTR